MEEAVIELVDKFGYIGIAAAILIENIFPPIPSEAVLLFGGYITIHSGLNPWLVILFATAGSAAGAVLLYYAGFFLGKERIKSLIGGRLGKRLGFRPESIDSADKWFRRFEYKAVLICRCIPVVRSIISIPAGLSRMKFLPFILLTILGSGIWNTILVWLGALAGDAWGEIADYLGVYSKAVLVIIAVAAVAAVFIFIKKRRKTDMPSE